MTGSGKRPCGRSPRSFAPLLVVLMLGAYPLFRDLGGPLLWEDEGDTAVIARNVARFGLPRAWDGRSFTDSDNGERVAPHLLGADFVMVGTPWLPFYLTAASFKLFGESAWSARLPFAVSGLATIALLYALVQMATGDGRAALAAAILLLLSTQFLLYARECRHYALNMLLSVALLIAFLRMRQHPREPWFVVVAVSLFHTQILPAAVGLGACGALTLFHPAFRPARRPFWLSVLWILPLTAPWLLLSWTGFRVNWNPLPRLSELPPRFGQFAIETSIAIPLLGWAIGIPCLWRRFAARDREWLALAAAVVAACLALVPPTLSREVLITVSLRYVPGLIAVAAGVSGLIVARASQSKHALYGLLLGVFGFTHLAGSYLPWLILGHSRYLPGTQLFVSVPPDPLGKLLNTQWWDFVRGLGVPNPGTTSRIIAFLREHAAPNDLVLTNYSWDNLYFHTHLPQGLRLPVGTPLHDLARKAGLPDYVVEPDHADWLVWRPAVEPPPGYTFDTLRAELAARGARLELVARLPDATWENRPELTSHRFPLVGYVFAPPSIGPHPKSPFEAQVFRVHWPQ